MSNSHGFGKKKCQGKIREQIANNILAGTHTARSHHLNAIMILTHLWRRVLQLRVRVRLRLQHHERGHKRQRRRQRRKRRQREQRGRAQLAQTVCLQIDGKKSGIRYFGNLDFKATLKPNLT